MRSYQSRYSAIERFAVFLRFSANELCRPIPIGAVLWLTVNNVP